jgi:membrane protease subunit (stomatin/prohibitin family)
VIEENKNYKRRIDALKDSHDELESELKSQLNRRELMEATLEKEAERIEYLQSEKMDLSSQLQETLKDIEILRRKQEKISLDQREVN